MSWSWLPQEFPLTDLPFDSLYLPPLVREEIVARTPETSDSFLPEFSVITIANAPPASCIS
jgi:hypothetical protein